MQITYLIFVHNNPHFLKRLIHRLEGPYADFYVHIDKKSNDDFSFLKEMPDVYVSSVAFDIKWGGISMVDALLYCCNDVLNRCMGDTIVFLSGQDYPCKSNEYIRKYLENNKDMNYITGVEIPSLLCKLNEHGLNRTESYAIRLKERSIATIRPRCISLPNIKQLIKIIINNPKMLPKAFYIWLLYPKRIHPEELKPFYGEFWWVLPKNTIEMILEYHRDNNCFYKYHLDSCVPDELFFNTLVYNLVSPKDITNNCLRFIKWTGSPSPENVTRNDISIIENSLDNNDILFIRKVADMETCNIIDENVVKYQPCIKQKKNNE